jgi:sigma-B regulation protein RsbU (phosphoserine phosphatase)
VVREPERTLYRSQNRKVPTIGVLVDWAASPYQAELLEAVRDAAASASVNLLCFVGGSLPRDPASANARHRIYQLCGRHNVDGVLLLSGTLTHEVGPLGLTEYCERFKSLPICNIGVELPVGTSVLIDNEAGMREGILHLIRDHGARRIAFIRGPLASSEAEARFSAYRIALAQSGLTFEPKLVRNGDFMMNSGRQAVQELALVYGQRLDSIDAIVASNDTMAAGVLSALEERDIAVPERIRVLGFDDIEDARLTRPALTTLKQPLEKQAREALRSLLDGIRCAASPSVVRLPTELVIRRSCGCRGAPREALHSRPPEQRLGVEAALMMRRQRIIDSLTRTARGCFGAAGPDWQNRLFSAILSDSRGAEAPMFPAALQDMAERVLARRVDLELCDELISALREKVLASFGDEIGARDRLEHSFHQARIALRRAAQRGLMREHLSITRRAYALTESCGRLSFAFDLRELAEKVESELPRLDIECCVIVTYQSERAARVIAGYDRRSKRRFSESSSFEPRMLLPPELLQAEDAGRSFLVLPLVREQQFLGHALFQFSLESAFACGATAEALSVAVCGSQLTALVNAAELAPRAAETDA